MICTGGVVQKNTPPEAHVMRDLAVSFGLATEYVVLEDKAQNTPEI
jgi:DUF218 domain